MADKERGVSRTRLKEARVERERMTRSCVPAHAWSGGSGKKEPRVSDKSDLNYTRPSAHSRPCNSAARSQADTRVRTTSFTPGFTSAQIALQRELCEKS